MKRMMRNRFNVPRPSRPVGCVDNTTANRRCAVRVEVNLSNGTELVPTERIDLAPGATAAVRLHSSAAAFES